MATLVSRTSHSCAIPSAIAGSRTASTLRVPGPKNRVTNRMRAQRDFTLNSEGNTSSPEALKSGVKHDSKDIPFLKAALASAPCTGTECVSGADITHRCHGPGELTITSHQDGIPKR